LAGSGMVMKYLIISGCVIVMFRHCNLFAEQRHHRTIGTQNISETSSNEFCGFYALFDFLIAGTCIFSAILYSLPSRYLGWLPYPWKPWQTSPHYVRKPNRPGF
jgi:hypothetical protein